MRKSSIQTDVELKLRMAGIKVLTEEEWGKEPGCPYLYVNASSYKYEEMGIYAFNISVELKQNVFLSRDMEIICYGVTTWDIGHTGISGTNRVNDIRDSVKDKVDELNNDYLEMNPKE